MSKPLVPGAPEPGATEPNACQSGAGDAGHTVSRRRLLESLGIGARVLAAGLIPAVVSSLPQATLTEEPGSDSIVNT